MLLPWQRYSGEVRDSSEFQRIAALPRRSVPPEGAEKLTGLFCLSDAELRPIQAQALAELHLVGGLMGLIRVGGGKTLITFLAPEMLAVHRPLLLIPAKLRDKTKRDFAELSRDWRSPRVAITIESYERLGRANWADFLNEFEPDMIICDEAHRLKNVRAAVTRRVGRYMNERPDTHFIALSGTLTRRSLMDFVHIAEWCLKDKAPVPLVWKDLQEWCLALDEESMASVRYAGGVLTTFSGGVEDIKAVREGVQRRIVETPGVVATDFSPVDASLNISDWWDDQHVSPIIEKTREKLYEDWELPGEQTITSAADVWRHSRELALGFYYRWEPQPPDWWLEPRREWSAFVRKMLLRSRSLDSEKQVADLYKDTEVFRNWQNVRKEYEPTVVPIWLDMAVVEKTVIWAQEDGIVWVDHQAVAAELERRGIPYYGRMGRNRDGQMIEDASGGIVASIEANKEGRNLQKYSRNLILSPPTTGQSWEQLLGRTHRDGQKADEVSVEIYFGCKENIKAFFQAKSDAKFQQQLTGSPQKLLEATTAFEISLGATT